MIIIKKKIFNLYYTFLRILFYILPSIQFLKINYLKVHLFNVILFFVESKKNFSKSKLNRLIKKFNYIFNSIDKINYDLKLLENNLIINLFEGNFDKWKKNQIYLIHFQNDLSNKSNFINKTNIRYIEHGYFLKTIGSHYTVDATIKAMKLGLINKQKLLCKFPSNMNICNSFMLKKWKKYIQFVDNNFHIQDYIIPHHIYTPIHNDNYFHSHSSALKINKIWDNLNYPSLIKLSKSENISCIKTLSKMGIKKKDWFVTVHLRSSNYKGSDNYRDVDINDYKRSFKLIIQAGGKIILMGSKGDMSLDNFDINFIDYANSNFKSAMMDIFLCSSCKFMFGTSSGLSAISYLFKKPIAMTNYLPTSTLYLRKNDLFIPRLLKNKKNNKIIPLSQQFSWPYSLGISSGHFQNIFGLGFIANSNDEIYNLAKEMLVKLKLFKSTKIKTISNNQKIFKKISKKALISDKVLYIDCNISQYFLTKYSKYLL